MPICHGPMPSPILAKYSHAFFSIVDIRILKLCFNFLLDKALHYISRLAILFTNLSKCFI